MMAPLIILDQFLSLKINHDDTTENFRHFGLKEHYCTILYNDVKEEICNVCGYKFYKKCSMRKDLVVRDDSVTKEERKNLNVANITRCLLQADTLLILK